MRDRNSGKAWHVIYMIYTGIMQLKKNWFFDHFSGWSGCLTELMNRAGVNICESFSVSFTVQNWENIGEVIYTVRQSTRQSIIKISQVLPADREKERA